MPSSDPGRKVGAPGQAPDHPTAHLLEKNRRLLIIDDNRAIHEDFRKILTRQSSSSELDELDASLFGEEAPALPESYEIDSAYQGRDGLGAVEASLAARRPYALAFVDMRMPPGWDGVETIERLWKADPNLQVVICTAYSDYSWQEIVLRLGTPDRLLILKKPFDAAEVCQMAAALTEKWHLARQAEATVEQLRAMVDVRTRELAAMNGMLQEEIGQRKIAEEQLRRLASHDKLTGLPNRALLLERIAQCLSRFRREDAYLFAILFLDLDGFKRVNDSLGHVVGDGLLVAIAKRLSARLRAVDTVAVATRNTLARLGGDEFVVLLDGLHRSEDAIRVALRIERELAAPFDIGGHEILASTSIGICVVDARHETPEALLRDADLALYQAKGAGKSGHAVFEAALHADAVARWQAEDEVRRAMQQEDPHPSRP